MIRISGEGTVEGYTKLQLRRDLLIRHGTSQQDVRERLIRNGAPAAYLRLGLSQEEQLFGTAFTSKVECYGWSDERNGESGEFARLREANGLNQHG